MIAAGAARYCFREPDELEIRKTKRLEFSALMSYGGNDSEILDAAWGLG